MNRTIRILAVGIAVCLGLGTIPAAQAAVGGDQSSTHTKRGYVPGDPYAWYVQRLAYQFKGEQWMANTKRCVRYTQSGTWYFEWQAATAGDKAPLAYRDFRVLNPKLEISIADSCSRTTGQSAGIVAEKIVQSVVPRAEDYKDCDLNPSFGVQVPWGVSWTTTPECSDKEVKGGKYTTHPGQGSFFDQNNDGQVVRLNDALNRTHQVCFKLDVLTTFHRTVSGVNETDNPAWDAHSLCASRANSYLVD